jgi:hypothetical protein
VFPSSCAPKRLVLGHSNEVDVIGHQAITDQLDAVPLYASLQQIEVDRAFLVSFQDKASHCVGCGEISPLIKNHSPWSYVQQ